MSEKKRKRNCLSVLEKLQILNEIDDGRKKKDVASKYGIPPSSLSTILKDRQRILTCYSGLAPKRKRAKVCKYKHLDKAMLEWVQSVREQNLRLSGTIIREKAQEYAKVYEYDNFAASTGWLNKFKGRHEIVQKTISGESDEVCEAKFNINETEEASTQLDNIVESPITVKHQPFTDNTMQFESTPYTDGSNTYPNKEDDIDQFLKYIGSEMKQIRNMKVIKSLKRKFISMIQQAQDDEESP